MLDVATDGFEAGAGAAGALLPPAYALRPFSWRLEVLESLTISSRYLTWKANVDLAELPQA